MSRHEWTDPEDKTTHTVMTGCAPGPLAREVLRLAAENAALKALRVRVETVTCADGYRDMTMAEIHGLVQALAAEGLREIQAERSRLAEECDRRRAGRDLFIAELRDALGLEVADWDETGLVAKAEETRGERDRLAAEIERLKGPAMPSGLPGWEETDHAYVDGRNEGRRDERARIRRELLEWVKENGRNEELSDRTIVEADERDRSDSLNLLAALDRIVPGEG